jgi:tetratricopeptide (TPR) repeat protein
MFCASSAILHRTSGPTGRRLFHAALTKLLPIKDVALESLPFGEKEALWLDMPRVDRLVEAGSVVGVLETKELKELFNVITPVSGRLTYYANDGSGDGDSNDYVSIGQTMISVDTDASDAALIQKHLDENNDQLMPGFIDSLLARDDGTDRHHDIALFLRDHYLETHGKKALEILKRVKERVDDDKSKVALVHMDVGVLQQMQGNFEAAKAHLQFAVNLQQQLISDTTSASAAIEENLMKSLFLLSGVNHDLKDIAGARSNLEHVLQLELKLLGDDHVAIADTHYNLAALHYQEGRVRTAISHYHTAIPIYEKKYGLEHVDTANAYQMMATCHQQLGNLEGAYKYCNAALKIRQKVQGERHIVTASVHLLSGQILTELYADLDQVEGHYNSAISIHSEHFGSDHPSVSDVLANFGSVYYQYQQFDKAIEQYAHCLRIREAASVDNVDIAAVYNSLGLAWYRKGELDRALDLHEKAYTLLGNAKKDAQSQLAIAIAGKGNIYKDQGQFTEALKQYERAHDVLVRTLGLHHPDVASSFNNMGQMHVSMGNLENAVGCYQTAVNIFEIALGEKHPHVAACHFNIGLTFREQGKLVEAKQEMEKAHAVWRETLGPQHPQTQSAAQFATELS